MTAALAVMMLALTTASIGCGDGGSSGSSGGDDLAGLPDNSGTDLAVGNNTDLAVGKGADLAGGSGADLAGSGDSACGDWKTGTISGYNNSDGADDPNAGSLEDFTGLTAEFYANVPIASIDSSDWKHDSYHFVDIKYKGQIGRVQTWDLCLNADCPDGTNCCTDNKQKYAKPGYLLDVETRTAKRLFGIKHAEDTLLDKIEYRVCGAFDPDPIAARYGAHR
jgi:hypothetical protein